MIAINAQPILDARLRGLKPAELVLVSMVGHIDSENHVVRAIPGTAYDWRWVRGLELVMVVGERCDWADTLKAIQLQRPAYAGLWNCTGCWGAHSYLIPTAADVAMPVNRWTYELDFLPWLDFQNEEYSQWN